MKQPFQYDDFGNVVCENCYSPVEEPIWLAEWDFWACPECAGQCQLTEEAERSMCPEAVSLVWHANSVREIKQALAAHFLNCSICGASLPKKSAGSEGAGAAESRKVVAA